MLFPDYTDTGLVYHVVPITDLKRIVSKGIKYDDKATYAAKYLEFHKFIDEFRPDKLPQWVERKKAIFASLNFDENHSWHSHTALLGIKINEDRCWISNENLANSVYESFILKDVPNFHYAKLFLENRGKKLIKDYWDTSLSFIENLKVRKDKTIGYDAEVLIFHGVKPKDIEIIFIISDHKIMTVEEWNEYFRRSGQSDGNWEIT
ncbi:hypothetical protein SAMN02745135_01901 [Caloranaerobacter azorensis DSM 13643]|uniref:DarT domain-containing protein n=1 Tax=Caloranaerobacter azorensis DSM 13643 TaxID=1121264 RepID=A0A1M5VF91_9FIRM|nr:hypothetical protein [Caloranaerobacter azorensis]SHH73900.1 hypothetical protein SAMN02745135_01901 [Caloranaerobacter azorensis DSM 13643]